MHILSSFMLVIIKLFTEIQKPTKYLFVYDPTICRLHTMYCETHCIKNDIVNLS